jgi:eukaryotic-like serine/threonine-protein kinase
VPETISHYRVLQPLGSGGMGEVYAGVDETLRRRVALKSIRAEHRLSPESKARFLREARILSQLDHPNICRVYDYIEGDDSDWLVLELIEGKSLQTALAAGIPSDSRLRIAQQIADVLVATHAAGVVHRDLKPGNVMLTRHDEVKVLDFGLAQSSERTGFDAAVALPVEAGGPMALAEDPSVTRTQPFVAQVLGGVSFHVRTEGGAVMGTPAYMSPEQARGEPATPASDMYSFGLLLQELYTGLAPYPAGISLRDLLERARHADTLPASGAPANIGGLIARLKQLAPAHRPTAAETAARLAWIRDRPRRFVRRLLVAGVVLAAALGGAKYTIDLARERTRAIAAREEADRRRGQAEDLIGFMLGDLRKRLEPVGRLEILEEVGRKAMTYFAAVPESALSDEELLRRSAALYQIGDVRIAQGNLEAATPPLQESLALARTLVERQPNDGDRLFGLGQSHFWVGFVHFRRHDLDAAEREFKAYLDISNRLTALDRGRDDWRREVAYANSNLGSVLEARGDLSGALVQYRSCLAVEEALLKKNPSDKDLRASAAASHNLIGVVLRSTGRFDEALQEFRSELAMREALLSTDAANATFRLRLGIARAHIGHVLAAQGRTVDAMKQIEQAVDAYRSLVAQDATNRAWRRELATGRHWLAGAYLAQGRPELALPLLREAIAMTRTLTDGDPTNVGWRLDLAEQRRTLAAALLDGGDINGAAREAQATLEITTDLLRRNPADILAARIASTAYAIVAQVWTARHQPAQARHNWQLAHDTIANMASRSSDYRLLDPLAVSLLHLERDGEAAVFLGRLNAMGYREPRFLRIVNNRGPAPPAR